MASSLRPDQLDYDRSRLPITEAEGLFGLLAGELQGHEGRAVGLEEGGDVVGVDADAADAVVGEGVNPSGLRS